MSRYDHKIEPSLEGIRSPLEEPIRRALGINITFKPIGLEDGMIGKKFPLNPKIKKKSLNQQ